MNLIYNVYGQNIWLSANMDHLMIEPTEGLKIEGEGKG